MKSGIHLFLALVLIATLSICAAAELQANTASKDGFQWGDIVTGFQMGIALDESNGIIHCRIRNATTNEMDYPSFDFGYFELIHLEISGSNKWMNVGVKLLGRISDYSSAFPYLSQKIGPGQTIPSDKQPSLKIRVSQKFRTNTENEALSSLYSPEIDVKSSWIQAWKNEKTRLFGR